MKPFDADGKFVSPLAAESTRSLTVRGAGVTMFASLLGMLIQLCSTMILARMLMPRDFGLVAMVTTFSLLLVNFGYNGFTEAIVQRDKISRELASNLFWINLACGVVLTAGFAASGSLLARLYHDPPVREVTEWVSLTIFATSLSTIHLALLKRAMCFSWVSVNDICARGLSVVLSILLAWMGFGYRALVIGVIATPVITCIGGWILCNWMPQLPRRCADTVATLRFALNTYGTFAVNYGSRNTDNLLVGWRFDAQSLGFYKKAYDLFALAAGQLVSSIAVVVVAGFGRAKKDTDAYRCAVLEALSVMAFLGMWVGAVLTVTGKDLILVALGPKWGPAGQIFTYFGPGIGIMMLHSTLGWIHLSAGRPDRYLRWEMLEFSITCTLFILALHWGPSGVAAAWSASMWILCIPGIWYAGRPVCLSARSIVSAWWRYFAASLTAGVAVLLILRAVPSLTSMPGFMGAAARVGILSILTSILYFGFVLAFRCDLDPVLQTVGLLRGRVQSSRHHDEGLEMARGNNPSRTPSAVPARSGQPSVKLESRDLPLVSILIPAFNAEKWIAETLHSALAQTYPRTEIIVVDDGSKDRTLEIARRFESRGVRVAAQKNSGASAARNHAFSLSSGDYIQWLDADDLLAPDKIARQMDAVLQGLDKRTVLTSPWAHFMYRPYRAKFIPTVLWCDLSPKEWLLRKMAHNVFMQTGTWLVSRELTEAAGLWDARMLGDDDGEYFCRVLLASDGVRFVPDAKVYYRAFRFDGLSYIGRFPEKIEAHWLSMQFHIQYLRSMEDSQETRSACLQYLRDNLIYFFPERSHIVSQANRLAAELGGPLGAPGVSWKYSWIQRLFGWMAVKPVQHLLRRIRWRITRRLDHLLFRIELFGMFFAKSKPEAEVPAEAVWSRSQ